MARYNEFAGPKLPTQLLEKVYGGRVDKHGKQESSRKEKRKAERQSKKKVALRTKKPVKWQAAAVVKKEEIESEEDVKTKRKSAVPAKDAKPVKSILKMRPTSTKSEAVKPVTPVEVVDYNDDDENEDDDENGEEDETDMDSQDEEEEEEEEADDFTISREAARAKLGDDDDVIAALERKLGMKGGKKGGSKAVTEDEWDFLMNGDLGEDGDEGDEEEEEKEGEEKSDLRQPSNKGKRKRGQMVEGKSAADDEWLQRKRRKARGENETDRVKVDVVESEKDREVDREVEREEEREVEREEDSGVEREEDSEVDSEEEGDEEDKPTRKRENPYIAPVTNPSSASSSNKYLPPSLRQPFTSNDDEDEEALKTLRRQLQGQLNRLSEANLPSILSSILEFYSSHARQHVTSVLISLLTHLISDPSVLTDTFLILHAGFSTALYRCLGPDFGAPLLESLVQSFDTHHSSSSLPSLSSTTSSSLSSTSPITPSSLSSTSPSTSSTSKQPLNLLAFLSTLYTLQSISHHIIFDYIRLLLATFSEQSTELLLRIIRVSGPQLRQDDPSALKDIVLILQRETAKRGGEGNLSVRTKFMMETILNLKNNRVKTGVAAKALSAEHMLRMKKILGGVKGVKTTEPLRITLEDLRESEKKGKWWLVGASWKDPLKHTTTTTTSNPPPPTTTAAIGEDEENTGHNLESLARSQGMNTSVRSAIFIAITGAVDFHHAQLRIGKLNLKTKQMGEIPRVLVHCVGMEGVYNHFYTLVAGLYAGEVRMKRVWGVVLRDTLRRIEDHDDHDEEGEEGEGGLHVKQIYCIAKLYAGLVAEGFLRITMLKNLEFGDLNPKSKIFIQVLLCTIFLSLWRKAAAQLGPGRGEAHKLKKEEMFEEGIREVMELAHAVPDMLLGLKFAVEKVVRGCEVLGSGSKAKKVVEAGCDVSMRVLGAVPRGKVDFEGRGGEEEEEEI